jgi:hypothetical protein
MFFERREQTDYRLTEPVEVWMKGSGCKATLLNGGIVSLCNRTLLYGKHEIIADVYMIRARSVRAVNAERLTVASS